MQLWAAAALLLLTNVALYFWGHASGSWRVLWALLPILPLIWMVVIVARRVREMDEYQRKLFFPGLAVGFTVSTVAAVTLGTLGSTGLPVPNGGWLIAVVGVLSWEVTNLLVGAPTA